MGYYTQVTGQIDITPPLLWTEIKDSDFYYDNETFNKCITFKIQKYDEETDEGTLTHRDAVAIIPVTDDSYKAYSIEDDLQELVDTYGDREFTGRLEGEGESGGDLWRLYVKNGKAVKISARIVWDDDEHIS